LPVARPPNANDPSAPDVVEAIDAPSVESRWPLPSTSLNSFTVTPASGVSSADRPLPLRSSMTTPEMLAASKARRSSGSIMPTERERVWAVRRIVSLST
jgi:hypothetical protein